MNYLGIIASVDTEASSGAPDMFGIVVIGFLFVMVVLTLIAAVTSGMGFYFVRRAAADSAKAARLAKEAAEASAKVAKSSASVAEAVAAVPQKLAKPAEEEEEDPALVAVISAAVHTMLKDRPHRIVSIRTGGPGWAQEGRRQIFSSHRVR